MGIFDNLKSNWNPEVGQGLLAFGLTAIDPNGGTAAGVQNGLQAYNTAVGRRDKLNMQQLGLNKRARLSEIAAKYTKPGGGFDMKGFSNEVAATGDLDLMKQVKALAPKLTKTVTAMGADGLPKIHGVMDSGDVNDTGLSPAEKLNFQNAGNRIVGMNPYTGQEMLSAARGLTPDVQARLAQSASQFERSHGLAQQSLGLRERQAAMMMGGARGLPQMGGITEGMPAMPESMQNNPYVGEFLKSQAREAGKSTQAAAARVPAAENDINAAMTASRALVEHPGFDNSVGVKAPYGYAKSLIPGTPEADWASRFEQTEGQKYLAGIESLRGFGPVTEKEGMAAAKAYNSLKRSTSQKEFIRANREYQKALADGLRKVQQQAGRGGEPLNTRRTAPITVPELPQKQQDFSGFKIERIE